MRVVTVTDVTPDTVFNLKINVIVHSYTHFLDR